MKNVLMGSFYTLQGLGNLVLGLFFIRGGLGGGGFAAEIFTKGFLLFTSGLSLLTALTLFSRRKKWAQVPGLVSSFFFCMFYVSMAFTSYSVIVRQYYLSAAIWLMLSILIVILNAVCVLFLYIHIENK